MLEFSSRAFGARERVVHFVLDSTQKACLRKRVTLEHSQRTACFVHFLSNPRSEKRHFSVKPPGYTLTVSPLALSALHERVVLFFLGRYA